jgi:hypothetical protein
MKTTNWIILLISLAAPAVAVGVDATNSTGTAPSSRTDYVSFRLISERNIFNPGRSSRFSSRPVNREPERRVQSERFALLGTMSYEKGRYAFFDGSSADFRRVAKPADSIAGFRITEVAPTCVKLETTNGEILELCVGMQMRKREDEGWQLAGKAEPAEGASFRSTFSSAGSASGPESEEILKRLQERREQDGGTAAATAVVETPKAGEPAPAAAPGESDDVLKRLLQKREQELNK